MHPQLNPSFEFLEEYGWWWPTYDQQCQRHLDYWKRHENDMLPAIELCKQKLVCIQAGGNVGLWPKILADYFETVYTFEPHPALYQCLVRNCEAPNVIKMQAVLGATNTPVNMRWKSIGAHWVLPEKGVFPSIRIDDLNLHACDAIFLDVEGFEFYVLQGAIETLKKYKPIIQLEDKEVEYRHPELERRQADKWLLQNGYKRGDRIGDDRIYLPE